MNLLLIQSLTLKKMFFNIFMASMMQVQQVQKTPPKSPEAKPARMELKMHKADPSFEPNSWPSKVEPNQILFTFF